MTQIDFYTNVDDKIHVACRIAAKAYGLGRRLVVFCPDAQIAQRFDRLLWSAPATAFVPHCGATDSLAALTPVVVDYRGEDSPHHELLLNLRDEWPAHFGRFERLVEIVSCEEQDRSNARERFRFYRDRGYDIRTHDLASGAHR